MTAGINGFVVSKNKLRRYWKMFKIKKFRILYNISDLFTVWKAIIATTLSRTKTEDAMIYEIVRIDAGGKGYTYIVFWVMKLYVGTNSSEKYFPTLQNT